MARGSRPRVRWHNDRVRKNKARLKRRAAAAGAARQAGETGAQARRSAKPEATPTP
ncbi:MAG TPA: hypothetical protein VG076_00170 [Acidimicrobiales bacterium]|nr:hypothetical protein [Acidimicrobiales bacterium]